MRIYHNTEEFKGGWFVGDFSESAFRTKDFEVCYKIHPQGETWPDHVHKLSTEINYLMSGEMKLNGTILKAPVVFVIEKNEPSKPEFLTECKLIVVKIPSVPGDKYIIKE